MSQTNTTNNVINTVLLTWIFHRNKLSIWIVYKNSTLRSTSGFESNVFSKRVNTILSCSDMLTVFQISFALTFCYNWKWYFFLQLKNNYDLRKWTICIVWWVLTWVKRTEVQNSILIFPYLTTFRYNTFHFQLILNCCFELCLWLWW